MSLERKGQGWQAHRQLARERAWTLHRQVCPQSSVPGSCVTWGKSLLHSGLNVFTCNWSLIIPTSQECQDEMMGVKTLSSRPHSESFHYPRCPGAVASVNRGLRGVLPKKSKQTLVPGPGGGIAGT